MSSENNKEKFTLDRLMALSDGVIAIALTLLVLGIDIPTDHNFNEEGLKSFFIKLEPGIIAYISSFLIVAIYWKIHHRIYNVLKYADGRILSLNIIFLFAISLVPFVSKLKTLYRFETIAVLIFAAAHTFTGLILFLTWKYFLSHRELKKMEINKSSRKIVYWSILSIPIICVLAALIAHVNIHVGTYLFLLIPIIHVLIYKYAKPMFGSKA